jgi:hypothetical protein
MNAGSIDVLQGRKECDVLKCGAAIVSDKLDTCQVIH